MMGGSGGGATGESGEVLLQEVDEAVGGRVVGDDGGVVPQLWLDLFRQLLPQLDAVSPKQKVSDVTHLLCICLLKVLP